MGSKSRKKNVKSPALPVLKRRLADTSDIALLQIFWAVDALQDNREDFAEKFVSYPSEAVVADMTSRWAVKKWNLETLITVSLNTPKGLVPDKTIDAGKFDTIAGLVNLLDAVETIESRNRINHENILLEMHRIAHRQFQWQRGWRRPQDLYRHLYIYGQGECAAFFKETYKITVAEFVSGCFVLFGVAIAAPWLKRISEFTELGVDDSVMDQVLLLVSGEIHEVRKGSIDLLQKVEQGLGASLPINYQPSYLRLKPVIRSFAQGNAIIAPLPDLILNRATVGLFYDLIPGGTKVMNDATARFEEYARRSISAQCPGFEPLPAIRYRHKRNDVDTPDILLRRGDQIVAVFECKATKLTFEAQYGEDPVADAKNGYAQIAKAIFQLWKFFSHVRRKIIEINVANDAAGIVLTMEPWAQMGGPLRDKIIADAEALAALKEPDIIEEDKRYPVFCPIQDLDDLLATSNEDQVLTTFRAAISEKYHSWGVREIRKQEAEALAEQKKYPFDVSEFLPWWGNMREARDQRRLAAAAE